MAKKKVTKKCMIKKKLVKKATKKKVVKKKAKKATTAKVVKLNGVKLGEAVSANEVRIGETPIVATKLPTRLDQMFHGKDVALLRECLAGIYKTVPGQVQKRIHTTLLAFAKSIEGYCKCYEISFVAVEDKYACLNCGKRHDKESNIVTRHTT